MTDKKPLVLDVDGTFLRTDMLLECFWAGLGRDPLATLKASATMLATRRSSRPSWRGSPICAPIFSR